MQKMKIIQLKTDQMEAGSKNKNREIHSGRSRFVIPVTSFCKNQDNIIAGSKINPEWMLMISVGFPSWFFNATLHASICHHIFSKLQLGSFHLLLSKVSFGLQHTGSKNADLFHLI
jgi:hypothetical protein